ncbi:MAG TPA: IS1595 family transposase, partial [Tepidisphaeraceae bacterium]|nr:IS1595 family transposase [Tepidisphaeraceae bacterium]
FNGVPKSSFLLFLKECEWRFNTGSASEQLKSLRKLTRSP